MGAGDEQLLGELGGEAAQPQGSPLLLEIKPPDDEACGEIKCRRQKIGTAKSQRSNAAPPASGPTTRATLFVSNSKATAAATWPLATTSPIMRRRTAISAAQTIPVTMPAIATCQTRNCPNTASAQSTPELPAMTKNCVRSIRLRLRASPTNPAIAPNKQHRQAAGYDDNGNEKSRVRGIVSKDARDQRLEPAHCISDPASNPKAKVVIEIRQQASSFTRRDDRLGKHFSSRTVESEPRA